VTIPAAKVSGAHTWDVFASYAYCTAENGGACIPAEHHWRIPVVFSGKAALVRVTNK